MMSDLCSCELPLVDPQIHGLCLACMGEVMVLDEGDPG